MSEHARIDEEPRAPAEVYEERFVPAVFSRWPAVVCDRAGVDRGQRVLDVACGTGILAREAAARVGSDGRVAGLDPNDEMLAVARRSAAPVSWHAGRAESMPFDDACFDRVVSQFGCMFFEDRNAAMREMRRVLVPGGRLTIAVCGALDRSPGYAVFAELLHRLFGASVAEAFRAPFVLWDPGALSRPALDAGFLDVTVDHHAEPVRFASADALVDAEGACIWTLGGVLDDEQLTRLRIEARQALAPFTRDGRLEFPMPAQILDASAPPR